MPSVETEAVRQERARLEAERAARLEEVRLATMLARVPRRFHEKRLNTFRPRNESQEAALEAAHAWMGELRAGRHAMLALVGPTGTGKSHLLYGVAWALFEEGRLPAIFRWYRFAEELKYGRGPVNERGFADVHPVEVRREWYEANPAFIDEARLTSGTEADATELAKFAINAYDEEISVFLTTNMNKLRDVMGDPAADRFLVRVLAGESFRGSAQ